MAVILICLIPLLNSFREASSIRMILDGKNQIEITGKEKEYNDANEEGRRAILLRYHKNISFDKIKAVNPIDVDPELQK